MRRLPVVGLVIAPWLPSDGGAQRYAAEIIRHLGSRYSFRVLTIESRDGLREPAPPNQPVIDVDTTRITGATRRSPGDVTLAYVRAAHRFVGEVDLVHAFSIAARHTSIAARFASVPVLVTPLYHSLELPTSRDRLRKATVRHTARHADRFAFVSQAEMDSFVAEIGPVHRPFDVIPPGIVLDGGHHAGEARRPNVVVLGRLAPSKRVELAVRIFAECGVDDAALVVLGDGPQRAALEALGRELGLGERIEFLGSVDDTAKARVLHDARVVLAASEEESFGIGVLEAVAAGARALISDLPAHREIATHSSSDRFSYFRHQDAVAEVGHRLGELLRLPAAGPVDHPHLRWDLVAAQYERAYEDLLATAAVR